MIPFRCADNAGHFAVFKRIDDFIEGLFSAALFAIDIIEIAAFDGSEFIVGGLHCHVFEFRSGFNCFIEAIDIVIIAFGIFSQHRLIHADKNMMDFQAA